MQVRITNVTDGVGKKPVEVRIYSKRLRPGAWMDVPVQFVDEKVRKLEHTGAIVIGKLPPWYSDYEARRKVRNLTGAEVTANVELKTSHNKKVAARKAAKAVPVVASVPTPAPAPIVVEEPVVLPEPFFSKPERKLPRHEEAVQTPPEMPVEMEESREDSGKRTRPPRR